jgi:hypothetical protein
MGGTDPCPHHLRPDEYDTFMGAAESRGSYIFDEMEGLLNLLAKRDPVRVWGFRRDLRWVRKQAKTVGYGWGE